MMVGTTVDLFAGWLVGFTSPYIMNAPYGNIGGKIGYIFAGMSVLSLIFAVLWVPELRGRSLEEVDELFEVSRRSLAPRSVQGVDSRRNPSGAGNSPVSRPPVSVQPSRSSRVDTSWTRRQKPLLIRNTPASRRTRTRSR